MINKNIIIFADAPSDPRSAVNKVVGVKDTNQSDSNSGSDIVFSRKRVISITTIIINPEVNPASAPSLSERGSSDPLG